MIIKRYTLQLTTGDSIALHDVTPQIKSYLTESGIQSGFLIVTSQHTTTALVINEYEDRLIEDVKTFLTRLLPPQADYLHNDIHLRDCPPDEPQNAPSHLAAMLLGSSEVITVSEGRLALGRYQSIILYELDGPRERNVCIQICGE
jgi:secondary thiamine-phosphate synthase enzyme